MKYLRLALSALSGIPVALLYGAVVRYVFGIPGVSNFLTTMTCGFLFVVPIAMGALTVRFAPKEYRSNTGFCIFMPWVSVAVVALGAMLLEVEAMICIVMALPLFVVFSSLGGMWARDRNGSNQTVQNNMLLIVLVAPYLITPLESRVPEFDSYRLVENQITIHASVDRVWENIVSVPYIRPEEQGFSVFHLLGVPKPLEATLSHQGIGGVRNASFESGLSFVETVTKWEEKRSLSFSIVPDKQPNLPKPFDQIGGKYFDILNGTYWIEPVGEDTVILHLSSEHRLSTHFNAYGGLWTDYVMSDLQMYILRIIRTRAETQ